MNERYHTVQIPFDGFYKSIWARAIDEEFKRQGRRLQQHKDWKTSEKDAVTTLKRVCNMEEVEERIARNYVDHFFARMESITPDAMYLSESCRVKFKSIKTIHLGGDERINELLAVADTVRIEEMFFTVDKEFLARTARDIGVHVNDILPSSYEERCLAPYFEYDSKSMYALLLAWMGTYELIPYFEEKHIFERMWNNEEISQIVREGILSGIKSHREPVPITSFDAIEFNHE